MAACAKLANDAIAAGNCAVIGLQSTGEANTNTQKEVLEEAGEDFDDLVSAPRMIIEKVKPARGTFPAARALHLAGSAEQNSRRSDFCGVNALLQYIRGQFPVTADALSKASLDELEYQVLATAAASLDLLPCGCAASIII